MGWQQDRRAGAVHLGHHDGACRGPFTPVTIKTGDVKLTPGLQYVIFFTTSSLAPGPASAYKYGATPNTAYPGGEFVFNNNGSNFGALSSGAWSSISEDLAFTASFLALVGALPPGAPINQTNAATVIDAFAGTLPQNFLNLYNLSGTTLVSALSQVDGEAATGAEHSAFEQMNEFLTLMIDPFAYGGGNGTAGGQALGFAPDQAANLPPDIALAYASILKAPPKPLPDQRWTAWGSGYGSGGRTNGDPAVVGSNDVTTTTYGYAAGMDYHYSPNTVLGFALGGGGTNWGLAQGLGNGRSDTFQAGVYGRTHFGPTYLAGSLAFANNWFSTSRNALGDQLSASFQGQSYGARLEGGYRLAVPSINHGLAGVTPYAAMQEQYFRTPAYSEADLNGGGFAQNFAKMDGRDTRGELGARFDDPTMLGNMPLVLRARLAWAHDWATNPALNTGYQLLPGTSFTVNGAAIRKDSALTTAGAQLFFTANWSMLAKFDGEFARGSQLYAGSGTLRYTW